MENVSNVSSEEELLQLRNEGKINDEEYEELLDAMRKSPPTNSRGPATIFRKHLLWVSVTAVAVLAAAILLLMVIFSKPAPVTLEEFRHNFPEKVASLNIDTANLDDVIRIFGEPIDYVWGRQVIDRAKIPADRYCIKYPDDVHLFMRWDSIVELRFESPAADYVFRDKIRVGSSLDEVLEVVGQPAETIEGEQIGWVNNVLYKNIEGKKGYCYYHRPDQNVRFFFMNYKVKAIYVTRSDYNGG